LKYEGAEPSLNPDQFKAWGAELDARAYMSAKAVYAFVQRTFKVEYAPHAIA
jgi:hypothetical protein